MNSKTIFPQVEHSHKSLKISSGITRDYQGRPGECFFVGAIAPTLSASQVLHLLLAPHHQVFELGRFHAFYYLANLYFILRPVR